MLNQKHSFRLISALVATLYGEISELPRHLDISLGVALWPTKDMTIRDGVNASLSRSNENRVRSCWEVLVRTGG